MTDNEKCNKLVILSIRFKIICLCPETLGPVCPSIEKPLRWMRRGGMTAGNF